MQGVDLKALRRDINQALETVGRTYNIQFKLGSINYTKENFSAKLEGASLAPNGIAMTKERTDFRDHAQEYGLRANLLDQTFKDDAGEILTIVGLRPRRRKYPISLVRKSDGARIKADVSYIKTWYGRTHNTTI